MVVPFSFNSKISSRMMLAFTGSNPLNGSSKIKSFGLCNTVTMNWIFCPIPLESSESFCSTSCQCLAYQTSIWAFAWHRFWKALWVERDKWLVRLLSYFYTIRVPLACSQLQKYDLGLIFPHQYDFARVGHCNLVDNTDESSFSSTIGTQ